MSIPVALANDALRVNTSFSILRSVAADLSGHQAVVTSLVGSNQNSHTHQLQAQDVQTMQASHLLVFNGLGFESAALLRAARNTKIPLVLVGEQVADVLPASDDEHEHHHEASNDGDAAHDHAGEAIDAHVWLDPLNMPAISATISKALMAQQPEKALQYGLNWQLYQLKLARLHGENVRKLAPIPLAKRKVLTSHHAFAYMGRRYQIDFYAPLGGGHEAEASAKTLVALIRQIKQQHIQAVFMDNVGNERLLQQLGKETGLTMTGILYSDALNSDDADYFSFYRHNIDALVAALTA